MSKLQRIARFNLTLAGAGLLIQMFRLLVNDPPIRLTASTITLILGCFLAVSYFRRRKLAKQGASQYDERDKSIHTTAALIGLMAAFLVLFAATLIAFLSVGPGGKVEIGSILGMFLLGTMSFFTTESAMVLRRYGSGGNDNE